MSDKPIVPTADEILTPALERMYELKPNSFQHIDLRTGVYWHPFLAFRSQAALNIRRLASLVAANRLSTAEGKDLQEYVASEYDAVPETDPTFAIGWVTLNRTGTGVGDIPKGTRIVRQASPTSQIPHTAAEYVTEVDVHFDPGQLSAFNVPIKAVTPGAAANLPLQTPTVFPSLSLGTVFDSTITIGSFTAAGGSDGADDDFVRRYAKAFAIGQYGPTEAESRYGVLRATGVRHLLAFDLPGSGTQRILVADASWGSSVRWANQVQQSLYDNDLVGFGCKVQVRQVRNKVISAEPTIVLRDKNFMTETTEIDLAVASAIRSYFDDRPDWNVWRTSAIQAVITRAHPKILYCPALTIKDVTGTPMSEIAAPDYNAEQYHYYLARNATKITYQGPS